ncbi:MAG TPA: hypothetical protein VMS17_31580 [Gemmataceae bacterium]|nr:hypothetical protein [Gemmataceae bacterium]
MNADPKAPTRREAFRLAAAAVIPCAAIQPPRRPDPPVRRPPPMPDSHPAHAPAVAALRTALRSLESLQECCCGDADALCSICLDADGLSLPLGMAAGLLESELCGDWSAIEKQKQQPSAPADAATAREAALLALYDALDALLDLSAFHFPEEEESVGVVADQAVYAVRLGLDLIGAAAAWTPARIERHRLSAVRKIERRRHVDAEGGGCWLPHAESEHRGAEEDLRYVELMAERNTVPAKGEH